MEQLKDVLPHQEIASFYSLLRQDPDFLHAADQKQFADTPLHSAAAEGRTQLALEILRLMPSLGPKLNPDGFTPLHLALQRRHTATVTAMIRMVPELAAVQGREGATPLHYAAETDDVDMVAEFLLSCPDSVEKLTVHEESAVHVAARNRKSAAFGVLLRWLTRTNRREVLRWRDWQGNTALHLAASTNQPKVMELLIKEGWVWVNDKNSKGLTALDMVMELPTHEDNGEALQILRRKRAKGGSSIRYLKTSTLAEYLSSKITFMEIIIKLSTYLEVGVPSEMRSPVLVVAVLIATATYQGVLHPPDGGFRDQTPPFAVNITSVPHNSSTTTTTTTTTFINITRNIGADDLVKNQKSGNGKKEEVTQKENISLFLVLNSIALAASLGTITSLLPTHRYSILLHMSLLFLMISYVYAMSVKPRFNFILNAVIMCVSSIVSYLILVVKLEVSHQLNVRASRRLMGSNNYYNINEVMTLVYYSKYQ